jgi:putative serine protease PepD
MNDQQPQPQSPAASPNDSEASAPQGAGVGGAPDEQPQARWWPSWGQQGAQAGGQPPTGPTASAPGGYPGFAQSSSAPDAQVQYGQSPYQQQPSAPHAGYGQAAYGATGWQTPQAGPTDQSARPGEAGGAEGWQHDTAVYATSVAPPPGPPKSPDRKGGRIGLLLAIAAITGLLAGGLGGFLGAQLADSDAAVSTATAPTSELPQAQGDSSPRAQGSVADIAARVSPAVVSISVQSGQGGGTGSGTVIRDDGYILTNNHVVAEAAGGGRITVRMASGKSYPATIVGRDADYDLAVIKIDATDLPTVTLGDSDSVVVGDLAIAIGSPLGLEGTVTAGIISALNRPVTAGTQSDTSFINAIQTDAAINPGNSGGALLNGAGQVIGVNSAIATLSAGGQSGSIGLGFAIPINEAKRIADELISTGKSTKPVIGVRLDATYEGEGARVSEVTPGSAADKAGMKAGDIIVKFNGRPVTDSTELIVAIRAMNPGDKVEVTVKRSENTQTLTVTLGSDSSAS